VDFYCSEAKPIMELDGGQRTEQTSLAYDAARTAYLEGLGYRVLRISNRDFMTAREAALERIWRALHQGPPSL
jgi:very-short-patch-repair endonuclease